MTDAHVPGATVRTARNGPVATVVLDRPDRRNALSPGLRTELLQALATLAADTTIRVVVLTGAGADFSAGADLVELDVPGLDREIREYNRIVTTLRDLPQTVIAKVRGRAIGAGCNTALACDFVVADTSASFAQHYPKIGLSVDVGGSWLLPRLVGLPRAAALALLGDAVPGPEAAAMGLIHRCVAPDELDGVVADLATRLAGYAAGAQTRTKRLLSAALTCSLDEALEREIAAQVANAAGPEFSATLAAFRTANPPTDAPVNNEENR